MKLFILIIGILFVFAGCAINQQAPSVCDTLEPGQSVICDMADKVGQRPETVASFLKLGNVAGLSGKLYTAQQADKFISDTINHLKSLTGGLTYAQAVKYVITTLAGLSPEVQSLFIVLDDFIAIDTNEVLTSIDIEMLITHLQQQKAIVAPFILVE